MDSYRIGVLASGGGSNLDIIIRKINEGELPVQLAFVISNNSKSGALEKAHRAGIPAYHVSSITEGGEEGVGLRMMEIIRAHPVDLLALAGYMKKVPPQILSLLKNRIVNIHPALLPAFGGQGFFGSRVHEAVIRRGCRYSGITIHMVNSVYDEGQIILQKVMSVPSGWTPEKLAAEVLKLEHAWYWRVLKAFAEGDIIPTTEGDPGKAVDLSGFQE